MSGRPKLGAVFRGEAQPDRTAGLAGLLSVAPVLPTTETEQPATTAKGAPTVSAAVVDREPASLSEPAAARAVGERPLSLAPALAEPDHAELASEPTPAPSSPRKPKRLPPKESPAADRQPEPDEDDDTIKMVPANIDLSVHADLRQFATRNELSFATVVLRAIEANAETLSAMWSRPRAVVKTGLFGSTAARSGNRRAEPAVQIQLRIPVRDAQILNDLVDAWQAPSRGAMITEALRLFVPSRPAPRA